MTSPAHANRRFASHQARNARRCAMKKFYTEVMIPRVKNWGSENRWEKLGPQDVKNTPRSPGKDRCVIEANKKAPASILERAVRGHSGREMSAARPTVSGVYRLPSAANNNDLRGRNPRLGCRAEVPESTAPESCSIRRAARFPGRPRATATFLATFAIFSRV